MKKHILLKAAGSRSRRTATFVRPGLAGLLAIGLALSGFFLAQDRSGVTETAVGKTKGNWYFRLGQWRADAKTLAAMVRYVIEPENNLQTKYAGARETMPTNSAMSCADCAKELDQLTPVRPVTNESCAGGPGQSEPM